MRFEKIRPGKFVINNSTDFTGESPVYVKLTEQLYVIAKTGPPAKYVNAVDTTTGKYFCIDGLTDVLQLK